MFEGEGGLLAVAESYKNFGLHVNEETGEVRYQEWAPEAQSISLVSNSAYPKIYLLFLAVRRL